MKTLQETINSFELDDRMLTEMASIGDVDNKLCVVIRMNDAGNIPHFHIMDKSKLGRVFHTCIKIESPEYFHHEGKEDILNSKQRKNLIEFFNQTSRRGITKWEMMVDLWNANNSSRMVDEYIQMPDYTKLK